MEEKVKIIIFVCLFVVCGVPIRYFFLYSVFRFSTSLYLPGIFAPLLEAIEMDFFLSFRSTRWRWYGNLCGIIHWWCWFSGGDWGEQKWQWRALVKTERQAKKNHVFTCCAWGDNDAVGYNAWARSLLAFFEQPKMANGDDVQDEWITEILFDSHESW